MPLSDIVRALNAPATGKRPDFLYRSGLDHPFVAAEGRVFMRVGRDSCEILEKHN